MQWGLTPLHTLASVSYFEGAVFDGCVIGIGLDLFYTGLWRALLQPFGQGVELCGAACGFDLYFAVGEIAHPAVDAEFECLLAGAGSKKTP